MDQASAAWPLRKGEETVRAYDRRASSRSPRRRGARRVVQDGSKRSAREWSSSESCRRRHDCGFGSGFEGMWVMGCARDRRLEWPHIR